jgi:hypothetical protein
MEYYENKLCISYKELIAGDPNDKDVTQRPIMSQANYKKMIRIGSLQVARRGGFERPALIEYKTMPTRFRKLVIAKYGEPEENTVNVVLRDMIVHDMKAETFYKAHEVEPSKGLTSESIAIYTDNASVLNAIIKMVSNRTMLVKGLGGNVKRIWPEVSAALNKLMDENKRSVQAVAQNCNLPRNPRRLKEKIEDYKKRSYTALISNKHTNNNASKAKEKVQEAFLIELLGHGLNIEHSKVAKLYNSMAKTMNWKEITTSTVANYAKKHGLTTYAGSRGSDNFFNNKAMQVKRERPSCPMYFWCVDGWDVELLYQERTSKKDGTYVTTYHHRPTVVLIVDPFNYHIVGYAIGTHETPALIRQAFRNAFEHTQELFGAYHMPWQLQTDNYGRGNLTPFYQGCAQYFTPAKAHNAKSKTIEPYLGRVFNKKHCRFELNSSGQGVTSKKENQVSSDWIKNNKKDFPDYAGCVEQIECIIAKERAETQADYVAKWNKIAQEDKLRFDTTAYLSQFGEQSARSHKLHGHGLVLQIEGEKFTYDCFDIKFRECAHLMFLLRYDPSNMDQILAIENAGTASDPKEGTTRFTLERKFVQPMALKDRKEGDAAELQKIFNFNKGLQDVIIERRKESAELVNDFFNENPLALENDTLAKLVITDSRGQHKNRRNEVAGRTTPMPIAQTVAPAIEDAFEVVMDEMDCYDSF